VNRDEDGGLWFDEGELLTLSAVSFIADNLWVGGCPTGRVDEYTAILDLWGYGDYVCSEAVDRRKQRLLDIDEMPDLDLVHELAEWVNQKRLIGPTLVHCQAGLNRSGLVAALALIKSGMTSDAAISLLRTQRDEYVLCNQTFEIWLRSGAYDRTI
jgi:hypothetical protein